MWIVTKEYNDYDQHGGYFVAVFVKKPDFKKLKLLINKDDVTVGKLTRGGGCQDIEYKWYIYSKL